MGLLQRPSPGRPLIAALTYPRRMKYIKSRKQRAENATAVTFRAPPPPRAHLCAVLATGGLRLPGLRPRSLLPAAQGAGSPATFALPPPPDSPGRTAGLPALKMEGRGRREKKERKGRKREGSEVSMERRREEKEEAKKKGKMKEK